MKRKVAITALVLAIIMLFSQFAFADELSIVKTIPSDGEKGKQPSNLAVKIVFSEDMSATANDEYNANLVTIKDPDGAAQSFTVVHHENYPNEIWFVLDEDLTTDTTYTVEVASGIKASSGATLADSYTYTFSTRDTKADNRVSLLLTVAMMVIMMVVTTKAAKKQAEGDAAKAKKAVPADKSNYQADPYRLSREQGISLDEAKALIAKEKEKSERKYASDVKAREKYEAEEAAKEAEIEKRVQQAHEESLYRVKTKGSMKEHGKKLPKAIEKILANRKKSKKKK